MSKTLLSESEIKDFMKYANLGKDTTKNFLGRLNEHSLAEAEEDDPEGLPPADDEPAAGAEPDMEDPEAEAPGEDPDAEAPGEDPAMNAAVEKVLTAVVQAMEKIPGAPPISIEAGEEGEEALGGELAPEPGEPGEPDELGAMGAEGEEAALMEALAEAGLYMEDELDEDYGVGSDGEVDEALYEEDYLEEDFGDLDEYAGDDYPVEEDIVNEVTRRVAARILKRKRRRR